MSVWKTPSSFSEPEVLSTFKNIGIFKTVHCTTLYNAKYRNIKDGLSAYWGHSEIEMGILKTLRRFMSTLGTFKSWPCRHFEHIGHIHEHIGHIHIFGQIGTLRTLETLGILGTFSFEHFGTLSTLGTFMSTLGTLGTFTFSARLRF